MHFDLNFDQLRLTGGGYRVRTRLETPVVVNESCPCCLLAELRSEADRNPPLQAFPPAVVRCLSLALWCVASWLLSAAAAKAATYTTVQYGLAGVQTWTTFFHHSESGASSLGISLSDRFRISLRSIDLRRR